MARNPHNTASNASFSHPPPRIYQVPTFESMSTTPGISLAHKDEFVRALNGYLINTSSELRRIEQAFVPIATPDISEAMTKAWTYFVDSNALLTELRGLTRDYPFSVACLSEAKARVYADPESNKSWNLCWLVLNKIQTDELISLYADYEAAQPVMWGEHTPTVDQINQLSAAFKREWSAAVVQFLKYWDEPPTRQF